MGNNLIFDDFKEIIKAIAHDLSERLRTKGKNYMFVEATHKNINNGKTFIGLFKGGYPIGKGYGMGWYGAEYLRFTRCLAVNEHYYNKFFPQISISTMLRIEKINAKNNKEARQKFIQIISERKL